MEIIQSSEWSIWNYCPTEILCLILSKVDPTTLLTCMQVNNKWRKVARYIARFYGRWKEIVKGTIEDEGVTFKCKSTLDWSELYTNSVLWTYVREADIILARVYKGTRIKNGSVYNDNLIVVDDDHVKYYDIVEGNVRMTLSSCDSIEESDSMIVIYKWERFDSQLLMYGKITADDPDVYSRTPNIETDTFMHKLDDDCCYTIRRIGQYTIQIDVIIWNKTERSFNKVVLGVYNGTEKGIAAMHICHDVDLCLYIICKCGKILQCQTTNPNGRINTIFRLNVPFYAVYGPVFTFHKYNLVVPTREGFGFNVTCHGKWDGIVIEYPKLTCVTDHGNVLLLGREDGKIDIYLKKKLNMKNYVPEKCIDLTNFEEYERHNKKVLWMDVHETNRTHHLFIGTLSRVFHIIIKHSPLDQVFHDEEY